MKISIKKYFYFSGFSLIELLVSITVIAVLLILVLTVTNRILANARGAKCIGNLRQIAMAVETYSGEHNGLLPPVSDNNEGYFQEAIALYVKVDVSLRTTNDRKQLGVLCCPEDHSKLLSALRSYAINYYIGRSADFTSQNIARRLECPFPSRILYLVDGFRNSTGANDAARFAASSAGFSSNGNESMGLAFRHGNKANALWLDGHVSSLIPENTINNTVLIFPKLAQ